MPLSEFYRLAKGKHKSAQQQQELSATGAAGADSSPGPGPSSLHAGDFVELVWENDQVMMKELPDRLASNNSKASHNNTNTSSSVVVVDLPQTSRFKEKGVATGGDNAELMNSLMNDFQISGPSELDLVPWLSYHSEDEHGKNNYSSDYFTELSGVTAAECSNHMTGLTPVERPSNEALPFKDSHQISFQKNTSFQQRDVSSMRPNMSQLDRVCSFPSVRPKVSYKATQNISCGESSQKRYLSSVHPSKKMEAHDLGQRVPSASFINFPHFAASVKPGLEGINAKVNPEVPFTKKVDCKDKSSVLIGAKPTSPSQIPAGLPISKSLEMLHHAVHSGIVSCQGISTKIDVSSKQATVPNEKIASGIAEMTTEPVVVSSVCSGNSVDRASNHPTRDLKRRYNESEDSENLSEDFEEESVDIKKAANNRVSSGSKRSRAAEVHNLSERRRRDRINEKMRALQELVPNCNKVDKASMLDEAIEYLKTLQLQVQMMSMGPGVCMSPMALPHTAHMPRFTPMGFGMGYGLSMNMNSSNYPPMQIPQFPVSAFGALNVNLPMFGFQGQGVAMPSVSSPACPPIKMAVNLNNASSGNMAHDINQERTITNQLVVPSDELYLAAALLKDEHPSPSKATEPSTKS